MPVASGLFNDLAHVHHELGVVEGGWDDEMYISELFLETNTMKITGIWGSSMTFIPWVCGITGMPHKRGMWGGEDDLSTIWDKLAAANIELRQKEDELEFKNKEIIDFI
ncbi:hypothetical protein EDB19DRAFT_1914853 [Suillus lakei]|nr:hypothetical protein EDB19DRAFT_1914853 [Suillus lakei]